MHAVLSPSAATQVVLLERTRNGSVFIIAPPFDLADPVVSDEGIAETGALVLLLTPAGDTLVAREDNTVRGDGKGIGEAEHFARADEIRVELDGMGIVIEDTPSGPKWKKAG